MPDRRTIIEYREKNAEESSSESEEESSSGSESDTSRDSANTNRSRSSSSSSSAMDVSQATDCRDELAEGISAFEVADDTGELSDDSLTSASLSPFSSPRSR